MSTTNSYQEQLFYHHILSDNKLLGGAKEEFFDNSNIRIIFSVAKEHALKYKEAPTGEQVIELVRIKGLEDQIKSDMVTALYNTKSLLNQYDSKWLSENSQTWIQIRNTEHTFRKGVAYLKTSQITPENVSETIEQLRNMMATGMSIDFNFNMGTDFFDPKSHLQERLARTPTGYPYIDKCLKGGWWKGGLFCFLSGAKAGKSLWLQNLTVRSALNGHNSMYITCELQEELVHMRLGSNMLNINIDEYEEKTKDQDMLRNKLNKIKQEALVPPGALRVKEFPSGSASVNDIRNHIKKEEETLGIKFENVFVDYINLIRNWRNPNSENLYIKIKQISEDLRAMGMEENWAIITVTQTNRGGWENEDLNMSNVSESAALIMTVDALFGIITSPELKAQKMYYLKYLADRVSGMENTKKKFNVSPKFARIEEDMGSSIEDMDTIIKTIYKNDSNKDRTPISKGIEVLDLSNETLF